MRKLDQHGIIHHVGILLLAVVVVAVVGGVAWRVNSQKTTDTAAENAAANQSEPDMAASDTTAQDGSGKADTENTDELTAGAYNWTTIVSGTSAPFAKVQACKFRYPSGSWGARARYYNLRGQTQTIVSVVVNNVGWIDMTGSVAPNTYSKVFSKGAAAMPTSPSGAALLTC